MIEKLKNLLHSPSKDFFLKVYAVVLAILVWFITSITLYPTTTKTVSNVPISKIVTEGTVAEDFGLSPVGFREQNVSVRIFGKRYEIGDFSAKDLNAYLEVSDVSKPGEYELDVVVKSKDGTKIDVKDISPSKIKVKFDSIIEKDFPVEIEAPYITAAEGFLIEPLTSTPSTIKIRGPKQEVEKITRVVVKTNMKKTLKESQSTSDNDIIVFNGDAIADNSDLTFETDDIEIRIPVFMQKQLPLKLDVLNAPPNFDFSSLRYTLSQQIIDIAAPVSSLQSLGEIHLGYLDLRNVNIDSAFEYNVNLPEKYKNLSGFEKVSVDFDWSAYSYKNVSIDKKKLFIINAPSKYEIALKTNGIYNIKLIGPKEVINEISSDDIIGEIDLLDVELNESSYRRPVQIYSTKYNNVWAYGNYSVSLDIVQKTNTKSFN